MARYRNIGGSHSLQDGTVVGHGGVFESETDPRKNWPNKFELADVPATVAVAPAAAPVAPDAPAPAAPEGTESGVSANATNVTADFPTAGKNDLTVQKDRAGYWITDDTDPVNEKALRTKKAVEAAIAEYIKG